MAKEQEWPAYAICDLKVALLYTGCDVRANDLSDLKMAYCILSDWSSNKILWLTNLKCLL